MLKYALAGITALAIGGSTLVYAQQQQPDRGSRFSLSQEDRSAMLDARIAAVRAGLKLTPEQEKNWPAVEAAVRDLIKIRTEQRDARRTARETRGERTDPVERLRSQADTMASMATGMKRVADAADPLYKSLDDSQKRRLAMLTRVGMRDNVRGRMERSERMDRRDGRPGEQRGWHRHHRGEGPAGDRFRL
jgi:hypothetical protein